MRICNATNIQRIFLTAVVAFVLGCLLRQTFAADKPNIIYILADDLGYGDLGCYGQQRIKTPRLDRMAAEGMRFTDHYSGSTVCAPSRCSLMTGHHTGHTYIRGNNEVKPEGQKPIPADSVTIPKLMKKAGYTTGARVPLLACPTVLAASLEQHCWTSQQCHPAALG